MAKRRGSILVVTDANLVIFFAGSPAERSHPVSGHTHPAMPCHGSASIVHCLVAFPTPSLPFLFRSFDLELPPCSSWWV